MTTGSWNGFVGAAVPITDGDIALAARNLGTRWSRLRGVMAVESAWHRGGDGFDHARRPKMLFETKLFYEALRHNPEAQHAAVQQGLASSVRPTHYPVESYTRLTAAIAIDETAALSCASWGFAQVLGSNYRMGGWKSVQEMVRDCMASEAGHLRAFCGFIKSNHLVDELNDGDSAGFARVYNGSGYARDRYDEKIDAQWDKFDAQPEPRELSHDVALNTATITAGDPINTVFNGLNDLFGVPTAEAAPTVHTSAGDAATPFDPSAPGATPVAVPAPQSAADANVVVAQFGGKANEIVRAIQTQLNSLNYPCGTADALYGTLLRAALLAYEADNSLPIRVDVIDTFTMNKIMKEGVTKPLVKARTEATASSPALKGSRQIMIGKLASRIGGAVLTFFGITEVTPGSNPVDIASAALDHKDAIVAKASAAHGVVWAAIATLHNVGEVVLHSPLTIAALSAAGLAGGIAVVRIRVQEHRDGKNIGR